MFQNVSMAGSGWLVIVLTYVLGLLGVNADYSEIAGYANNIMGVIGLALIIIGQLRRKDLTLGFWRK